MALSSCRGGRYPLPHRPPSPALLLLQGERLLSAGRDRAFRVFSVIQDQQSRELSQRPGGGAAKRARQLGLKQEDLKLTRLTSLAAGQVSLLLAARKGWCDQCDDRRDDDD